MSDQNAFEATMENGVAVVSEVDPAIVDAAIQDGVLAAYEGSDWIDPVRRAVASWAEDTHSRGARRDRTIFDRNKFVTPGKIFEQMAMAEDAMDDDVVGGVYDTSEAMAFNKMAMQCSDPDQRDIWNQIAADLNFDEYLRILWRELFKVSQYYGVMWWGTKSYRVRGKGDQRRRRKEFNLRVPIGLGVLDPTRVVPVAFDVFGNHSLAWIADEDEFATISKVKDRVLDDSLVQQLFLGPYTPPASEKQKLSSEDINVDRLFLLNPDYTWNGHLTKASYERWARVRTKSIFPLLDMKHQLREMDRAFLLGGINFIVLVKKGTDEHPVQKASEVTMVAEQMRAQAKSSVIVSDHRLEIEIITPDLEGILNTEKWATLDDRIRLRLWGSIAPPGQTGNTESQVTLAKVVSLGISNRRHMLRRDIEANICEPIRERNEEQLTEPVSLEYAPRRIDLLFDPQVATIFQEIRDRGDLSRETILDEFGFDLNLERQRREEEKDNGDDDTFQPVNVPFDSPTKTTPGGSGRQGGRPPGTPQPKTAGQPDGSN